MSPKPSYTVHVSKFHISSLLVNLTYDYGPQHIIKHKYSLRQQKTLSNSVQEKLTHYRRQVLHTHCPELCGPWGSCGDGQWQREGQALPHQTAVPGARCSPGELWECTDNAWEDKKAFLMWKETVSLLESNIILQRHRGKIMRPVSHPSWYNEQKHEYSPSD